METEYKTLSSKESQFLSILNEEGRAWFRMEDAYGFLPEYAPGSTRALVKRMAGKGLITRITPDLYWVVPMEQDAATYLPSWHLLAEALTSGTEHYIGFYSALAIHGLITQPALREQIVTSSINPRIIPVKGIDFQLIKFSPDHFFGAKKVWIDSFSKVRASDLEKTFIDCLFKPDYAGSIIEVAKALWTARGKLDYDKLLDYCRRFGSQVVIKRLGFLLEHFGIGESIVPALQEMRTATISPLDTEVPDSGRISTRWSLRINTDMETIDNAIDN